MIMADADKAIAFVLSNEGGFVDNPSDSGGATNFGLSLRFLRQIEPEKLRRYGIFVLPELLTVIDVKNIDLAQAKIIYKGEFWDNAPYVKIESQPITDYVFDMVVNHGETQAIKLLQRSLWAIRHMKDCLVDDGILGSITLDNINFFPLSDDRFIVSALMAERAGYMRLLCVENPKNKEFLDGWLNRCYRI